MHAANGYIASAAGFGSSVAVPQGRLLSKLHSAILLGFLIFTLVGTLPFIEVSLDARSDGNILDRIAVLGLFGLSVIVLAMRWRVTARAVLTNAPLLLLIVFCMASIVWSEFPGLTLRRGALIFFLTVIALAIAVGTDDAVRLYRTMVITLSVVIAINLIGTVLLPSQAISELGVKGLYTQKNVAGIVAMVTILLGVAFVIGSGRAMPRPWVLAMLVAATVFLVVTRSKTSINLTAIGVMVMIGFALCERWGKPFILFGLMSSLILILAAMVWLATLDFDTTQALATIVGDTSFSGRDELWAFAGRAAEKRYWLGYGYGAFWDVGHAADPLLRAETGSWLASVQLGVINQAHDGYLELRLHIGLPATILATILTVGYMGYGGLMALAGRGSTALRACFGGLAMMLAIHLAHNLTEATMFMRGQLFFNLAILAMFMLSRAGDYQRFDQTRRDHA